MEQFDCIDERLKQQKEGVKGLLLMFQVFMMMIFIECVCYGMTWICLILN